MISVVQTGMEHQRWDSIGEERMVIAVRFKLPRELQLQPCVSVLLRDDSSQALARPNAEDFEVVVSQLADHVDIESERDSLERDRRVTNEVLRSDEPIFFPVPKCKQDRTFGRLFELA